MRIKLSVTKVPGVWMASKGNRHVICGMVGIHPLAWAMEYAINWFTDSRWKVTHGEGYQHARRMRIRFKPCPAPRFRRIIGQRLEAHV